MKYPSSVCLINFVHKQVTLDQFNMLIISICTVTTWTLIILSTSTHLRDILKNSSTLFLYCSEHQVLSCIQLVSISMSLSLVAHSLHLIASNSVQDIYKILLAKQVIYKILQSKVTFYRLIHTQIYISFDIQLSHGSHSLFVLVHLHKLGSSKARQSLSLHSVNPSTVIEVPSLPKHICKNN
jgi:hypothetical protein